MPCSVVKTAAGFISCRPSLATTMPQLRNLPYCVLYLFTWPYYGTLVRYTIEPLECIAAPQKDLLELSERVRDFALGKGEELKYISFAVCLQFLFFPVFSDCCRRR